MDNLEALLAHGRTKEALAEARERLAKYPADRTAKLTLVKGLLVHGAPAEAEAALRALEADGVTADTLVCRAALLRARDDLDGSLDLLKKALALAPELPEAHFGLGLTLAAKGAPDEALPAFSRAVQLAPKQGAYRYHLAQALLAARQPLAAIEHAVAAVQLNPLYSRAYLLLARMLLVAGQAEKAQGLLRDGLKLLPDDALLLGELANVDLVGGNVGGAFDAVSQLAQRYPNEPGPMGNLAQLLLTQRRYDEALEICRRFDEQGRSTTQLKMIEATVHEAAQPPRLVEAVACYQRAMFLSPNDWRPANNLGQLWLRMKDPRAVKLLEYALECSPGQVEPTLNLALAHAAAHEYQQSQALAEQVLRLGLPQGHEARVQAERLLARLAPHLEPGSAQPR